MFAPLTLEESQAGGEWKSIASPRPDLNGKFETTVKVGVNTSFRIRVGSSRIEAPLTTSPVRILARRGVALTGAGPGTTRTGVARQSISLTARVTPGTPNVAVTMTVERYDPATRRYVLTATTRRTTSAGLATFSWRPTGAGSYRVLLSTPSTSSFTNGISPSYRWKIT